MDWAPGLGVEDVGAFGGSHKVICHLEGGAVHLGVFLTGGDDLGVEFHLRRAGQHRVATHHAGGDDRALGHRARLVDTGGVGPGHDELDALEAAELFLDRQDVGQGLEGVVLVTFHVEDGDVGPVGEVADHLVCSAVDPVHRVAVAADGDGVAHAGQYPRHVGDALGGVGHLFAGEGGGVDLAGVQEVGVATQLGHPGLEGIAGAQGLVVEDHEQGLCRQDVVVQFPDRIAPFEIQRHVEDGLDFFLAPIEQGDEVTATETFGLHLNCTSLENCVNCLR